MIGASGAINGVVGMYLVFYPENDITCFWAPCLIYWRKFSVSSFWMILLWLTYDILGAKYFTSEGGGVAYFAHLGGFAGGFGLAILMLKAKMVKMERYEKSLLEFMPWRKDTVENKVNHMHAYLQGRWRQEDSPETKEAETTEAADTGQQASDSFWDRPLAEEVFPVQDALRERIIRFTCSCGKMVKVSAKYAGKTGKCPRCGNKVIIPAE